MPSNFVLDTVVLRVMAFADPDGIDIVLAGCGAHVATFPIEVYNQDEDDQSIRDEDPTLSELARGIRYARRQAQMHSSPAGHRYQTWLTNAQQLPRHLRRGSLVIDPLHVDELPDRERLSDHYGIGRGEAASLVLAARYGATAVFLSSDRQACAAADDLGYQYRTLEDVLIGWVSNCGPTRARVSQVVDGMRSAKFGLKEPFLRGLLDSVLP